jgi:hypothetical protein
MSVLASWLASPPPDAAIEIATDRVAAAALATRGSGLAVTAHAIEPLAPGVVTPSLTATNIHDRAAVVAALRRAVERLGTRVRRVALVIPDTAVKVSLLRFDHVPPRRDDLDQLVRWQLRKAAPFPVDDARVTYSPGAGGESGGREFVVEMARNEIVREYEAVCDAAGVYAGLIDTATLAVLGLFSGSSGIAGDWLLVHVRPDYTSIAILRGEHVIFYRSRPEDEGLALEDLVHQTTMYYQDRLSGRGFVRVLLAGGRRATAGVDDVRGSLENRLGAVVETVDVTRVASLADRIKASADLMDVLGPLVGLLRRTYSEARA